MISALLETRSAVMVGLEPTPMDASSERVLVLSNLTGTMQLSELSGTDLRPLTALDESVSGAWYVPGTRQAVLSAASGGNERDQLYLIDLDVAEPVASFGSLDALTDAPEFGHHCAGVSPDGALVAYTSNAGNGVDFDLWVVGLEDRRHRLVWPSEGWAHPTSGFSPDGRFVALARSGTRPLDDDLVLVEVSSGDTLWPLPHPDEAALFEAPVWISDTAFYVSANVGRDLSAIVRVDLADASVTTMPGTGVSTDAVRLAAAPGGGALVLVENRDCATPMCLYDPTEGPGAPIPWPEPGLTDSYALPGPRLSADGQRLYFTLTTPRDNADVYRYDVASGTTTRLTHSPSSVDRSALAPAELHTIESFDGEPIQLFLHRPAGPSGSGMSGVSGVSVQPPPVVVLVHGGPESQSALQFNPIVQALVAAGFGVVVPNVRGSTGYGKRFAALDDTVRRLDSVADLAAVHGALDGLGFDAGRAALWGGSYGGYMVLAGVSMQPALWAAGVDIVGISDLVTFLANTSPYRRAHRELEYGSLEHDREFLVQASPMTHVDAIAAPLFIIHGRNDPRVPVGEAIQLDSRLTARGIPCELLIYEDEGHGLARLENRLDAYPRAIAFLEQTLGLEPATQASV